MVQTILKEKFLGFKNITQTLFEQEIYAEISLYLV